MPDSTKLWTRDFLIFNAAIFLAFVNVAAFFYFNRYLHTLPIDPRWFGLLIGLFSAVSLILRPLISPLLHADNSRPWIAAGTVSVAVALAAYSLAGGLWSLGLLRLFHGAAHVVLATALMTLIVSRIPPQRSGQAFGLISIVTLLPYAVIPPLLPPLMAWLGGYTPTLAFFGLIVILILPALLLSGRAGGGERPSARALTGPEIRSNLTDRRVVLLLSTMFLFYCCYAVIFYFLVGFAKGLGVANAGLFFTLSTAGEIAVRVAAGKLFDRLDKVRLAVWTLIGLAGGYVALTLVSTEIGFYALGAILGLGWGVILPVLNARMFDVSPIEFRAFNTNLGLQMFQAGFFIGPFAGGLVLHHGGYEILYYLCAALTLAAAGMISLTKTKKTEH